MNSIIRASLFKTPKNGFSIVELIFASALTSFTVLTSTLVTQTVYKAKKHAVYLETQAEARKLILELFNDPKELLNNIIQVNDNNAINCAILENQSPCPKVPKHIKLSGHNNPLVNIIGDTNVGFQTDLTPCDISHPSCVGKIEMEWEPVCPAAESECLPRYVLVRGKIKFRTSLLEGETYQGMTFKDNYMLHTYLPMQVSRNTTPPPDPPPPVPEIEEANETNENAKMSLEFSQTWAEQCLGGDEAFQQAEWVNTTDLLSATEGAEDISLDGASPNIPYYNYNNLTATARENLNLFSINHAELSNITNIYGVAQSVGLISSATDLKLRAGQLQGVQSTDHAIVQADSLNSVQSVTRFYGKLGSMGNLSSTQYANLSVSVHGPNLVQSVDELYLRANTIGSFNQSSTDISCVIANQIDDIEISSSERFFLFLKDSLNTATLKSIKNVEIQGHSIDTLSVQSVSHLKLYGDSSAQPLQIANLNTSSQNYIFLKNVHVNVLIATSTDNIIMQNSRINSLQVHSSINLRLSEGSVIQQIVAENPTLDLHIVRDEVYDPLFLDVQVVQGPFQDIDVSGGHVGTVNGMNGSFSSLLGGTIDNINP